jgi:hypothetical protein
MRQRGGGRGAVAIGRGGGFGARGRHHKRSPRKKALCSDYTTLRRGHDITIAKGV